MLPLVGVLIFVILAGFSMMTTGVTLVEPRWPGEFIMSEMNGTGSRDNITVDASVGGVVYPCTVLGQKKFGSATSPGAMNVGPDTVGTLSVSGVPKLGVYTLECIVAGASGKFNLTDPQGLFVGEVTVGTPFTGGGLTFTITDVGGHAAVGDWTTITVPAGSGKYVPIAVLGSVHDGTDIAAGILYDKADATSADAKAVGFVRNGEINASRLLWGAGATATVASVGSLQDTIATPACSAGVQLGIYSLVCNLAGATGTFVLTDPNGLVVGTATVGTQFVGGGLTFTVTDAGSHAVLGDTYNITVIAPVARVGDFAALGITVRPSV